MRSDSIHYSVDLVGRHSQVGGLVGEQSQQALGPAAVMNRTAWSSSIMVWHTSPAWKCEPAPRARPYTAEAMAQKRSASSRVSAAERPRSRPSVDSTTESGRRVGE